MSRPYGAISLTPIPCPAVSATAPHPVLRRFRRDAASLQSGAASTTMLSRHTAFGCASAPPHRHYERERWRRGIGFHAFVEMTIYAVAHLAEQKIVRQVILSSGTSTPKGAYANGM